MLRKPKASGIVRFTLSPQSRAGSRPRVSTRALAVCAALAALVTLTLWPSLSFAAILPACENDYASHVAVPAEAPEEDACEPAAARGDDIDNSRVAPICDSHGASAVAPPRIRGVPDIRFEASRTCPGSDELRTAVSPGRGDPPAQAPEATIERGILPILDVVGPPALVQLIDPLAPTGGPREGVRHGIYHPPR